MLVKGIVEEDFVNYKNPLHVHYILFLRLQVLR